MKLKQLIFLSIFLTLAACKDEQFAGVREQEEVKVSGDVVTIAPQVDFLFIIDDSQSMNHVQLELLRGMQSFVNQIQNGEKKEWDVRIAAVSTTPRNSVGELSPVNVYTNSDDILVPPLTDSVSALNSILLPGITSGVSNYEMGILNGALFLENFGSVFRPDALLVVVAITNEEDFSGILEARPGFDGLVVVKTPVQDLAARYTAAKGDGDLIRFISLAPLQNTSCDALRMPAISSSIRYPQISGIFQSNTINICDGVSEEVPVGRVLDEIKTEIEIVKNEILMNYITLDREPLTIDYIEINGRKHTSGFQNMGYQENFNISTGFTTSGGVAPAVTETGYIIRLPLNVTYTSQSTINIQVHYVPGS